MDTPEAGPVPGHVDEHDVPDLPAVPDNQADAPRDDDESADDAVPED